jgi:uncharacterized protein YprB with RNaseH-like and TPR domain
MRVAYIDIETNYVGKLPDTDRRFFEDYKNHLLTVVGIRTVDAEQDQFIQIVGEDITRESVLAGLKDVGRLITYNGRSKPDKIKRRMGFDFPVISAQVGVCLDDEFSHVDLVPLCWSKNLYGGQKVIERTFGLLRKLPGKDGKWAMETWRRYLQSGEKNYLEELLAYNREDVYMLRELELRLSKMR